MVYGVILMIEAADSRFATGRECFNSESLSSLINIMRPPLPGTPILSDTPNSSVCTVGHYLTHPGH